MNLTASRPSMMVLRRSVEVMLRREPAGGGEGEGEEKDERRREDRV